MKIFPFALLVLFSFSPPKGLTSTEVVKKMYNRYHGKWHTSLAFNQTTGRYRNDSLIRTETWHERIIYPDLLRIDFGDETLGNGAIYKGDSLFVFRNHKVLQATKGENELIFFLGGIYFKPYEQVISHFADLHIDLAKFHETTWKGKAVYVLGADADGDKLTQLWIDKDMLVPVRYFKYDKDLKEEVTFEDQQKLNNGWSETNCKFYINDKLLQTESYHNLVTNPVIDKSVFDAKLIGK
ncbi:hypothetical protein FFF34_017705 [Inquilinus sp. KBS0705]|nr:hypothetical protein FFF34_017705 [Inquilinus sp. KBS0705]